MEIKLQEALTARKEQYGLEIPQRFINQCLKVIDPRLQHIAFYVGDHTGEKFNKPTLADGSPNPIWPVGVEAPRDPEERKKFYADLKQKQYESWIERINSGEFDSVEDTLPEQPDRLEPSPPVEVVKSEPAPKPASKPKPKPVAKSGDVGQNLLTALADYISSTDSPSDDQPDYKDAILKLGKKVAEQQEIITKQTEAIKKLAQAVQAIGQKVPEMIKEEILKKFS